MKRPIILFSCLLLVGCMHSPSLSQLEVARTENAELAKLNRELQGQVISLKEEIDNLWRALINNFKGLDTEGRSYIVDHIYGSSPDMGSTISLLLGALDDEDFWVSRRAHSALYDVLNHIGQNDKDSIQEILEVLALPDKVLQVSALWALGKISENVDGPIPILVGKLAHKDARLREVALKVLGTLGHRAEPAIPQIVELLNDTDWVVRISAVTTLGEIGKGAASAGPSIRNAMKANGWEFKKAATVALQKIKD